MKPRWQYLQLAESNADAPAATAPVVGVDGELSQLLVVALALPLLPYETIPLRTTEQSLVGHALVLCIAPRLGVRCASLATVAAVQRCHGQDCLLYGLRSAEVLAWPPRESWFGARVRVLQDVEPPLLHVRGMGTSTLDLHHEPHVLRRYDGQLLRARALVLLKTSSWAHMLADGEPPPADPNHFSYWLAACMAVGAEERCTMMQARGTSQRLRLLIGMLLSDADRDVISCARCGALISSMSQAFNTGDATHVNPHGVVHALLLVHQGEFVLQSLPSSEHSWFPGFTWEIIGCASCDRHIGWRFVSEADGMTTFIGLTREGVRLRKRTERDNQDDNSSGSGVEGDGVSDSSAQE